MHGLLLHHQVHVLVLSQVVSRCVENGGGGGGGRLLVLLVLWMIILGY